VPLCLCGESVFIPIPLPIIPLPFCFCSTEKINVGEGGPRRAKAVFGTFKRAELRRFDHSRPLAPGQAHVPARLGPPQTEQTHRSARPPWIQAPLGRPGRFSENSFACFVWFVVGIILSHATHPLLQYSNTPILQYSNTPILRRSISSYGFHGFIIVVFNACSRSSSLFGLPTPTP